MQPEDLYEPERHEPVTQEVWDEERARAAIQSIASDTEAAFADDSWWPNHPGDTEGQTGLPPCKGLYFGAAGVLWALDYLARREAVQLDRDWRSPVQRLHEAYCEQPDFGEKTPSYHFGEVGVALVARVILGDVGLDDRLHALIRDNIANPTLETVWGGSGTLLAAESLHARTGEDRWRALFVDTWDHYLAEWRERPEYGCRLWLQDMYGYQVMHVGSGHGFAGNVQPILRHPEWLSAERRDELYRECARTLRVTARTTDEFANWPQSVGTPRPGRTDMLVQWCHGAPGMVTGLADFPAGLSAEVDDLLVRAGELTWSVGPLRKGYGLCHGAAGNGYAFLELFHRTGESRWLERARAFAMHALTQMTRMRGPDAPGRYTLWTGDLGVAVYLLHCLRPEIPRTEYPLLQPPA